MRSLLAGLLAAATAAVKMSGTVYFDGNTYSFVPTFDASAAAYGAYSSYDEQPHGFGELAVWTNASYPDAVQMHAAGYLEAALMWQQIYVQASNVFSVLNSKFNGTGIPSSVNAWYASQEAWVAQQISSNTSTYWRAVGLLNEQFAGMQAGYSAMAPANMSLSPFQWSQLATVGDMLDILPAVVPSQRPDFAAMTPHELADYQHRTTACSSLIKVTGNYSDLFFGHSTWFPFSYNDRIWKHYTLRVLGGAFGRMSFSSYPGYMHSFDDFYSLWDSGLWVTETTNDIFDPALWDRIASTPQTLFAWQRVRLASHLATSGAQWVALFADNNPSTYNNQYQVLSVGLFKPGQPLVDGTLWIVESMPGMVRAADVTQHLERGHWPSYNVPFSRDIYDYAGYPQVLAHHAEYIASTGGSGGVIGGLKYQLAPRAQIFRRDQGAVDSVDSLYALLRSNDYLEDPYAAGSPWNAICARGDLSSPPAGPVARPDGCIDTKVSSWSWWQQGATMAINGPSLGTNDALPPFSWAGFPSVPHAGLPTTYNFAPGVITVPTEPSVRRK